MRDVAILLADATLRLLAQNPNPNNFGDTRSGGLAGPIGLFIILLLAIATVLLIRNMNRRLRRLPDRFPSQTEPPPDPADPTHPNPGGVDQGPGGRSGTTAEGP